MESLKSIDETMRGLCDKIRVELDVKAITAMAEAVRALSQAYNIRTDAQLAQDGFVLHYQQTDQLPGETPVSN